MKTLAFIVLGAVALGWNALLFWLCLAGSGDVSPEQAALVEMAERANHTGPP